MGDLLEIAREQVESDTGITAVDSTWTYALDCWPSGDFIEIPSRPISSVTSIAYVDTAGASQTFSSGSYTLDNNRVHPVIWLDYGETWPSLRGDHNSVTITYQAGYADASEVPSLFKYAVRLQVARSFEDRTGQHAKVTVDDYDRLIARLVRSTYP